MKTPSVLMKRQMLYRTGTSLQWEGLSLDFVVVDASIPGEIERHLDDGWFEHPYDTREVQEESTTEVAAPRKRGRPRKVT